MNGGYAVVADGPLRTDRLTVNHVRARPPRADAPKALLLGGSNFDLRLKRGFLDSGLPDRCDVVAYEPRGVGETERPPGAWTMADYADDARAVLDALGWERVFLIGESFGGMTALHLAAQAPTRFACMLLSSATAGGAGGSSVDISAFLGLPPVDAARRALTLQDQRNEALARDDPDAFDKRLAARIAFEEGFARSSIDHGGYARLLDARRGHDAWAAAAEIRIPTLVLLGRFDRQAPPDAQRALADRLPAGECWEVDGGHGALFGDAGVFAAAYDGWCARRLTPAAR